MPRLHPPSGMAARFGKADPSTWDGFWTKGGGFTAAGSAGYLLLTSKPGEAYGKRTGRRNVLHLMCRERIDQRRGVPFLAPVIESLKQLGRYTDAELVAAVVSGMFTVFIEKKDDSEGEPVGSSAKIIAGLVIMARAKRYFHIRSGAAPDCSS